MAHERNQTLALLIDGDNVSPKFIGGLLEEIANYGTAILKHSSAAAGKGRFLGERRETLGKVFGNAAVPFAVGQRFPFAQGEGRHQAANSEKSKLSLTVHRSFSLEKSSSVIPPGTAIRLASRKRAGP